MHPMQQQMQQAGHFSIDVECVATGTSHNDRAVAQIALVDQWENVLLNAYVRPEQQVVNFLTPLTGLTADVLQEHGVPLQHALQVLRQRLPRSAVLVGQSVGRDVDWLGLREGTDFASLIDLAGLFRVWNKHYNSWSVFGQDHLAKVLLGWNTQGAPHDACGDAIKSIRLFNMYQQLQQNSDHWVQAKEQLLRVPPEPSFAKQNPSFEGVCMGGRWVAIMLKPL